MIDRYGIPPELIPDFYGLKGDTSDNTRVSPGSATRRPPQLLQRFGDLETVLARRRGDLRRQAQGEPHQPRRRRARVPSSSPRPTARSRVEIDLEGGRRLRARPIAVCVRSSASSSSVTPCDGSRRRSARGRRAAPAERARRRAAGPGRWRCHVSELAGLRGELATLACERALPPDGGGERRGRVAHGGRCGGRVAARPFAPEEVTTDSAGDARVLPDPADDVSIVEALDEEADLLDGEPSSIHPRARRATPGLPLRFAAYAGGEEVLTGEAEAVAGLELAWGDRPVVAHDWKAIATLDPPPTVVPGAPPDGSAIALEHDTRWAAYLLDPCSSRVPARGSWPGRAGLGAEAVDGDALARRAILARALAERQRAELAERQPEAALRPRSSCRSSRCSWPWRGTGVAPRRRPSWGQIGARSHAQIAELEREVHELAGGEFTIGSPQQLGRGPVR